MKNLVYVLKIMLPLVIICAVTVGLLAFVNSFTAPVIAENDRVSLNKTMASLFEEGVENETLYDLSRDGSNELYKNVKSVYLIRKNGETLGYCFDVTGNGAYKGKIEVLVALNADGTVKGVGNLPSKNNETSSIGGAKVLENDGYLSLYEGKDGSSYTDVELVSGATKTSTALRNAVKNALDAFENLKAETEGGAK